MQAARRAAPKPPLVSPPRPRPPPKQKAKAVAQPDELIDFHHLKMRKGLSKVEVEDRWVLVAWLMGLVAAAAAVRPGSWDGQRRAGQGMGGDRCESGWLPRYIPRLASPVPATPRPRRSVASDLARATGLADAAAAASSRLNKIVQLTGFSDPIYAEAYVTGARSWRL